MAAPVPKEMLISNLLQIELLPRRGFFSIINTFIEFRHWLFVLVSNGYVSS